MADEPPGRPLAPAAVGGAGIALAGLIIGLCAMLLGVVLAVPTIDWLFFLVRARRKADKPCV